MVEMDFCHSILIAEDNDDVREAMVDVLRHNGYEVHGTRNGEDALNLLRNMRGRTLVLLDLLMPVMNGWQFLDIQKEDKTLAQHPIVTISASELTEDLEYYSPLKTDGKLTKPISLEDLLTEVAHFCGIPSSTSPLLLSH